MRQIKKKRTVLVLLDKLDGLVGVELRQFGGIDRTLDDITITHQGHTSLVLEINDLNRVKIMQQTEIVIEALVARQERLVKAEVPFADASGRIAVVLQQLGNRQFVGMNARSRICAVHPSCIAYSARVTTGQQAGS